MWAALLPLAPAIFKRVLTWIGLGVVSFVGIDAVFDTAVDTVNDSFSGMGYDSLQYFLLSGSPTVLKQVLSAHATVMSIQLFKRFGFV